MVGFFIVMLVFGEVCFGDNESTGRDVKDVETPVFFVVSVACKSLGHQSKYDIYIYIYLEPLNDPCLERTLFWRVSVSK